MPVAPRLLFRAFLLFVVSALAVAALAAPAHAQSEGAVAGTFSASASSILGWSETIQGTVRLRLAHVDEGGNATYELEEATLTWHASGTTATGCTVSGDASVTEQDAFGAYVVIGADSTYHAGSAAVALAADPERMRFDCPRSDGSVYTYYLGAGLLEYLHVPTAAEAGTPFRLHEGHMAGTWGSGQPGDTRFTWSLEGVVPQLGVELVVTPEGYETWMPRGNAADPTAKGNALNVRAELLATDGGPAPVEAVGFRFEFLDVSREPGATMNWPLGAAASVAPDLRMVGGDRVTAIDVAEGAWVETGGGRTARAELWAYDFGAFATVRVVATLADGREVLGHLRGNREYTAIRLPMRAPDSFIADVWKAAHGVEGQPDAADIDGRPAGDGVPGDGLTLYEEYRGFRENRRHLRTDPARRDYFLVNRLGAVAAPGIALFAGLSDLAVHARVREGLEMDTGVRVINANHARGAHVVDQHGVWLRRFSATAVGRAVGTGPGPPRTVEYVELSSAELEASPSGALTPPDWFTPHVAHELFHTVGVFHHGERDPAWVEWIVRHDPATGAVIRDAAGNPVIGEGLADVEVFSEAGLRMTPLLAQINIYEGGMPTPIWLAEEHGQHSGNEQCVMRYATAQAYRRRGSAARYWTGGDEAKGRGLCTSPLGTGINDAERYPRYRHGYADQEAAPPRPHRGDCLHQIHVSDAE